MARVEFGATFSVDLARQIEALRAEDEWSRIDRLAEDVVQLADRLAWFPELGRELAREGDWTLRRIAVGRLPYLVWYRYDPKPPGTIKMSRLLHAHQRTPKPRLPESL